MDKKPIDYWLEGAAHDIDVAETLYSNAKYDYCLFIGHLAIEKVLKAFYIRDTKEIPPKIHNLLRLAESTNLTLTDDQMQLLGEINRFNIAARYPDYKGTFYKICTKEFTNGYFTQIKELYEWLILKMKP